MQKHYPVIVEQDEDGIFIVDCLSLDGCRSYGKTIDEAMDNIGEVIEVCLDAPDNPIPMASFIGVFQFCEKPSIGHCVFMTWAIAGEKHPETL
jgi:predicted RNase H-like HicB family nuclease